MVDNTKKKATYTLNSNLYGHLMRFARKSTTLSLQKHRPLILFLQISLWKIKNFFQKQILVDFNNMTKDCIFPKNLKFTDVSPVLKNGDRLEKSKYRTISILPAASKIFEQLLYNQINKFVEPLLFTYQCSFRTNLST